MNHHLLKKLPPYFPKFFSIVSLLGFIILPCTAFADDLTQPTPLVQALQLAKQKNLADSVAWRRLLYFTDNKSPQKADTSRIINRFNTADNQHKFFVNPNGGRDTNAELQSTITGLFDTRLSGDSAIACRFPARVAWLKQQLTLNDSDLPRVSCPSYQAWQAKIQPQTAEIVFATEYLDSPPSAFAHSFLLFNNPNNPYYLNYTPRETVGESSAKFSYKSAIAGNAGEFAIINYAQGIQDYKVLQGRDVWRYQLKLSPSQVEQLSRQVFEVKDQILPYYLLDQNCASEILVLLNTLFPQENLLAGMKSTVAPAQIVRRLQDKQLIEQTYFEPSDNTIKQAATNTTRRYAMPANPIEISAKNLVASRNNPLLANRFHQWQVGYAYQDTAMTDSENLLKLGYRMVYHDPLDKPTGYPLGSQMTALSADVLVNHNAKNGQDDISLEQATLIQMRSLNPVNTIKNKASWGTQVGLEQVFDKARGDGKNHLVGNIDLEYGKSFAYGTPMAGSGEIPPNICYALGDIATQFGKGLDKGVRVGLGANLGCIQQFGDRLRGVAELNVPYWISGDSSTERYWQPKLSIGTQYDLSKFNAIRLLASREWLDKDNADTADKLSLSYVHYFE